MKSPILFPATVLIDRQEKAPYAFTGIHADADKGYAPLLVRTKSVSLQSGDYSLEGYESKITVERKSLEDLFGTLGQRRERFSRLLERMARMDHAAVVIEATLGTIVQNPPAHSELSPKSVVRSMLAWRQRYPTIDWWTCDNRRLAEVITFRILQRFYCCLNSESRQWHRSRIRGKK
jgi:ERCC4-type nuclease